ncbi:hypothetical protein TNCV_2500571 [Trichonephila clavipes]|nr:hypothetical protein TNCV_2500571 [Trichonephila clavipes]
MSSWIQDQESVNIIPKNIISQIKGYHNVEYIKTKFATINGEIELRDLVAALWDKKLAFRTRERRKFWVFTDGPQRKKKKTSSEAVQQLNSASEKESVLLQEDQTNL